MIFEYMCEKKAISSDFEDGQTPASVSFWQELLAKDQDGALSVCRKQIEALTAFAEVEALSSEQLSLAKQGLERILHGAEVAMGKIPAARGFFTSASDRIATHRAVCGFLEFLKNELSRLNGECLRFSELYSLFRRLEAETLLAEAHLADLQKTARRTGNSNLASTAKKLLETLSQRRARSLEIFTRAKGLEGTLEGFCAHTCREFCRFAAVKADLEHEGTGASPAELTRLLWGLREESARLLKEI